MGVLTTGSARAKLDPLLSPQSTPGEIFRRMCLKVGGEGKKNWNLFKLKNTPPIFFLLQPKSDFFWCLKTPCKSNLAERETKEREQAQFTLG